MKPATSKNPAREAAAKAAGTGPSHVRWQTVGLLALISGLTYADRLNLGMAAPFIQAQYHFDTRTMGWILSAFSMGYALFHVPGGWLGDRFGGRAMLAMAVLWWSVFTAATAVAPQLPLVGWLGAAWAFAAVRFVMGTGEAAALPVGNRMMADWFGDGERAFGTSIFLAGIGAGGVLSPPLLTWLNHTFGWQVSFAAFGAFGVGVAGVWYYFVRDRPEEHPRVNRAELALIRDRARPSRGNGHPGKIPWGEILANRSIWGVTISHFCLVYPVYIFFTWYFIYMVKVRGVTISKAGIWASAPFLANLILVPMWGWLGDRSVAIWGKRRGRRAAAWLGIGLSAIFLWSGTHTSAITWSLSQLALAAGFNFAASAMLWPVCNDVAAEYSGSVSGFMNTFGSLGGWLSPILTAYIVTWLGWEYALDFATLVTLMSGLAWFLVRADESLDRQLIKETQ